jgi:hypothetical protein
MKPVLSVSVALPCEAEDRPPIVLVHGAANSASVWAFWVGELVRGGWPAYATEEYGITGRDVDDQPAMPDLDREERLIALASLGRESRLARDERKRGVVVEALGCPLLVVTGSMDRQWPRGRYDGLWLGADYIEVDGASHWGLVLDRRALARVIPGVLEWLARRAVSRA